MASDVAVTPQPWKGRPTAKGLGITTEKPKFLHYSIVSKRMESFTELEWPMNSPVEVKDLVEAGLVYTGVGDSVRCYYCGGGLRNWEVGDDPMVEHAKWYPNCGHVMLVKGQKFIKSIADGEYGIETDSHNTSISNPESIVPDNPSILAVKEMGYSDTDVVNAVHQFRTLYGHTDYKAVDICRLLIEMEDNTPPTAGNFDQEDTTDSVTGDSDCEENLEDLQSENDRLRESMCCKICLENLADVILLPCGHIMSCGQCAPALEKCPVCRKDVNGRVKAFYSRQIPGAGA